MHHEATTLGTIAERVRPLLPAERRTRLQETLSRAEAGQVRVLVLGEAKRGKSTLVNALNVFQLGSACVDEAADGVDESGGPAWAGSDLAEDFPGLELGVRAFAGAA